ncbi:MAG: hypothetical protein EKK53_13340 [Burkholderiales bacterium]|nr:MAG: hypothetical protein EKK53_13340 [Burkholderiales bacterium]
MNLSRQSPAPTRYVGIGLVAALHLAGIYALSAGLIKPVPKTPEATVLLPRPDDRQADPIKQERIKVDKPVLTAPVVDQVKPLPWVEETPQRADAAHPEALPAVPGGSGAGLGAGSGTTATPPVVDTSTRITAPGAVCSVMPRPEVPVVNWTGEAVLNVVATVRGGRVVGTEVRVAQGAVDGKTRRSLQRAVETALAGYQCQGDAMFQQDFAFRID